MAGIVQSKAVGPLSLRVTLDKPPTLSEQTDLSCTALEFEEFSFWKDGVLSANHISKDHHWALAEYLGRYFDAHYVFVTERVIAINYEKDNLEDRPYTRPFSIAGLIAVWQPITGPGEMLSFLAEFGFPGGRWSAFNYQQSIRHSSTLTVCLQIRMVVSLPEMSEEVFIKRLCELPKCVTGGILALEYSNGPLQDFEPLNPRQQPMPRTSDELLNQLDEISKNEAAVIDTTDYAKRDGKFYPGTMVCSINRKDPGEGEIHTMASAGICVKKDGVRRLTCSYNNWESQDKTHPGALERNDAETREIFQVVQGTKEDGGPGTRVGWVEKRFGDSDVIIAQLDEGITFENKILSGLDTEPKVLLRSDELCETDEFLTESYAGGRERLRLAGVLARLTKRSQRSQAHPITSRGGSIQNTNETHIRCRQQIYMRSGYEILRPRRPDGSPGSVLVRCATQVDDEITDVLERGQICAMVHSKNIRQRCATARDLLVFAESFDPLIDDGWEVDQFEEERGPTSETPSTKKRKLEKSSRRKW
ncbi:hypothetical protein Dda_8971 [Drechslerella dactyloides]|uniref:Uncharacterized protein n=1 Tax=Drechslerella dactyloides TaxID=74499 RepID=A0AAD6NEM2_DREDA|nr:hypothetical protein Dda_8971 [Drechslerella dactyloides]